MSRRYRLAFLETICGSKIQRHYPGSPRPTNGFNRSILLSTKDAYAVNRNSHITCNSCVDKHEHSVYNLVDKSNHHFDFDLQHLLSPQYRNGYANKAKDSHLLDSNCSKHHVNAKPTDHAHSNETFETEEAGKRCCRQSNVASCFNPPTIIVLNEAGQKTVLSVDGERNKERTKKDTHSKKRLWNKYQSTFI